MPSVVAHAQLSTTAAVGTVTDATGAAIPDATVTLTQTETNVARTVTTRADGAFRAEFLPVGPYKLKVTASGYKAAERSGIVLQVLNTATLDVTLSVGDVSEVVNVTSDVPLIKASNATLGRVVENREVDNLPLVGRDVYQLLTLTPGVQLTQNINNTGFPEQHTLINGSTDGTVGQISYYLDGGTNMTGLRNTGNILPNPDAVREFTVQTANFSAEFGRSSAGSSVFLPRAAPIKFMARSSSSSATQPSSPQRTTASTKISGPTIAISLEPPSAALS
jgi:hypothetical protein